MNFERVLVRLRQTFLVFGGGLAAIGVVFIGLSSLIDADSQPNMVQVRAEAADCASASECGPVTYAVDTPAPSVMPTFPANTEDTRPRALIDAPPRLETPATDELETAEASDGIISDTLTVTQSNPSELFATELVTTTDPLSSSLKLSPDLVAEDSYTSTAQVRPRTEPTPADKELGATMVEAQTLSADDESMVPSEPAPVFQCPASSETSFDLIPINGPPTDHPDVAHGDLNLTLRGYQEVVQSLRLLFFYGATDSDPPQLSGLFQPNRAPDIKTAYGVNEWIWESGQCDGRVHGCSGSLLDEWEVTMLGVATEPGEPISIPERGAQIYSGGFKAVVLFADERQITLGYTRRDTVAAGYVVHIIGVCVDPNLLTLYRAQNNAAGWRTTGRLPALRNDQVLGVASGVELKVAIRDNGSFMDPRSSKDWWRGY